jgi:DNA (cytosine-5)-methyltransferase 1
MTYKISKTKNVVSLFSGCGGFDLGFEGNFCVPSPCINTKIHKDWVKKRISQDFVILQNTSFKTVFANDINPKAKLAWINYFSKSQYLESIYNTKSIVDIIKEGFDFPKNISIVTGGFPCQDFSVAGKRLGLKSSKSHTGNAANYNSNDENRGNLYLWMKKVIEIIRPNIFIAENVKGLISLSSAYHLITKDFVSTNDYLIVKPQVLHAANYGVPQSRERIFFIGFLKESLTDEALKALSQNIIPPEFDPYPPQTHTLNDSKPNHLFKDDTLLPAVNCGIILKDLPEPEFAEDESQRHYSKAKFLHNSSQGQAEINLNKIGPTIRSEHHGNIEYRRLSKKHGGTNKEEYRLPERRLTVRECARLQTFPDDYEFVFKNDRGGLSASDAYKLIGNAVPPLLAYNFAKRLEKNWELYFGNNQYN